VEPLPVADVLALLFQDTRFSIVADPGIDATFNGELKEVTLRQALNLVLHPLGLDWSIEGTVVRVFRRRVSTRMFDVNFLGSRRTATRSVVGPAAGLEQPSGTGNTEASSRVTTVDDADVFSELGAGIQTLLSAEGRFNVDRKAALVQVTDFADQLDRIAAYLEAVQTRVQRQVLIEAQVLEVDAAEPTNQWWGLRFEDLQGRIRLLATQGRVNVLANPRVVAMNNEPAVMRIGTQDVAFVSDQIVDPTTGRLRPTFSARQVSEGLMLSVTPQISSDGIINMSITHSTTERTGVARSKRGDAVPILAVREADTVVRVAQGETVAISGLTQQQFSVRTTKLPFLPIRQTRKRSRKTDVVILLTPTVLTSTQIAATAAQERERLREARDGAGGQK
jgi:MSHA biogenesis protein MshL